MLCWGRGGVREQACRRMHARATVSQQPMRRLRDAQCGTSARHERTTRRRKERARELTVPGVSAQCRRATSALPLPLAGRLRLKIHDWLQCELVGNWHMIFARARTPASGSTLLSEQQLPSVRMSSNRKPARRTARDEGDPHEGRNGHEDAALFDDAEDAPRPTRVQRTPSGRLLEAVGEYYARLRPLCTHACARLIPASQPQSRARLPLPPERWLGGSAARCPRSTRTAWSAS